MSIPKHIQDVYAKSKCLFTVDQIEAALDKMAQQIHYELQDKNPVVICVMIGGLIPMGNLLPRLDIHMELDYVHATRYCGETAGGELKWKVEPSTDLTDRNVLIIDDILDGGITLQAIAELCEQRGAKKVYTAVLVDKKEGREPAGLQQADFVGLDVDNHFIFGYGMDYDEYLRNAPGIYMVDPEHE